jgi:hypothetical protein
MRMGPQTSTRYRASQLVPGSHKSSAPVWRCVPVEPYCRQYTVAAAAGDLCRRHRSVVEYYDFGVYGYAATTLAALSFPSSSPTASLLATLAVFAIAFGCNFLASHDRLLHSGTARVLDCTKYGANESSFVMAE